MIDAQTATALQSAMAAAQRGDIDRARHLAEEQLATGVDAPAINAFLGMVLARAGQSTAAAHHLRLAHLAQPADITIACNLIAAQLETGELELALLVATEERAFADRSLRLARYRGYILQSLERFEDAAKSYSFVVEHDPADFESWNNLGNAHSARGRYQESIAALKRAVSLNRHTPQVRLNLAAALSSAGQSRDAEIVLRQIVADFPDDAQAWVELHALLKDIDREGEALHALESAVACQPLRADLQLALGIEYGLKLRTSNAEAAYRAAIGCDPLLGDAYLGLAVLYEHSNRTADLAPLVELGETNGVDEGTLAFIRALDCRRASLPEEGLQWLDKVSPSVEPERAAHLRATLLDRLGQTGAAFAAFEYANGLHAANPGNALGRAATYREDIQTEIALMSPQWVSGWTPVDASSSRRDPVFLVGFPRSGTTLLDTFLMGHAATAVMEEQPPLNHVDETLGGMAAIAGLQASQIAAARAHYFLEADAVVPHRSDGLLIDKSPLFLMKVPLIQRLFPNARFILALRHPCDVILSCFMSNFRLNRAMSNFLRLEDAARFYDLAFRHWEVARALLPVNVHTVVYERLVEDPAAELRPLFEFLDLDWRDEALDHARTAKARGLITTASYAQVAEPIYKDAAGRWKRYRAQLEPVFPTLAPWVDKFGYSL